MSLSCRLRRQRFDCGDIRSHLMPRQVQDDMLKSGMQNYAIGICEPDWARKLTAEEQHEPDLLEELAEATSGRQMGATIAIHSRRVSARIAQSGFTRLHLYPRRTRRASTGR